MGNDSLVKTERYEKEAAEILESDSDNILAALTWALKRNPFFGQQLKKSNKWVWVLHRGGYAYLVYYSISGETVTLESVSKRTVPVAPGPLDLDY
jgi:hypothetical protein